MKHSGALCVLLCLVLGACRSPDGTADEQLEYMADEEVMRLAYDVTYTAPENFFVDERADTPGSYTIYHVKDDSISYELCTDSDAVAMAWEDDDNVSRSVNGIFVELHENDRYFEIVRELDYSSGIGNITDPTSPGFSRVFKCSYVNRDGVDRELRDGYAGTLNVRPLSKDVVRDYVEYMWQFTFFWPAQKTVLETFSAETADSFRHTLRLAFITNRGYDRCDLVQVVDWVFTATKSSGEVSKEFNHLYQFEARLVNGRPERCG